MGGASKLLEIQLITAAREISVTGPFLTDLANRIRRGSGRNRWPLLPQRNGIFLQHFCVHHDGRANGDERVTETCTHVY